MLLDDANPSSSSFLVCVWRSGNAQMRPVVVLDNMILAA